MFFIVNRSVEKMYNVLKDLQIVVLSELVDSSFVIVIQLSKAAHVVIGAAGTVGSLTFYLDK